MKVCSFIPSATHMIYEMGLERYLEGVTHYCPSDKLKIVNNYLNDDNYSSEEINTLVSEAKRAGKNLFDVDIDLLSEIKPDLVFTQEVCDVCSIDTSVVQRAINSLEKRPKIVPLTPRCLKDVYQDILTVANELGHERKGLDYLAALQKRVRAVTDRLREHQAPPKRVMLIEWLDPIYNNGHWMPDQIALAGGIDMLSNPSGDSVVTSWEKIKRYDPEVLVISPCGFNLERSLNEIMKLSSKPDWEELTAVKKNQVYFVDSNYFTMPSGSLVDGIELLAALFHPTLFTLPENHQEVVRNITIQKENSVKKKL